MKSSSKLSYIAEARKLDFNSLAPIMYHPKYWVLEKLANQPTLSSLLKEPELIETGKGVDKYSQKQEIGYLRVGDIKPYKPRYSKLAFVDSQTVNENNLSILQENDILISRVGTVGVVSLFYENPFPCTFSDNVFRAIPAGINPHYLVTFLNTKYGLLQIERVIKGTLQGVINTQTLGSIRIFVPSNPNDSQRIGDAVFDAYKAAEKSNDEANEMEASLDNYIQEKVGYSLPPTIKEIAFTYDGNNFIDRLDPKFYHPNHVRLQESIYNRSETKLEQLCDFPDRPIGNHFDQEQTFLYVDISSIDRKTGEIRKPKQLKFKNAPQRATQIIRNGDIVVSLTRPTRNAIALVPHELDGQICSSGFAVMVAKPNIDSLFLLTLLRTEVVRLQMQCRARGSMYPAILLDDLKGIAIPFMVSDIKIQRELAQDIKSRIECINEKRTLAHKILTEARQMAETRISELIGS